MKLLEINANQRVVGGGDRVTSRRARETPCSWHRRLSPFPSEHAGFEHQSQGRRQRRSNQAQADHPGEQAIGVVSDAESQGRPGPGCVRPAGGLPRSEAMGWCLWVHMWMDQEQGGQPSRGTPHSPQTWLQRGIVAQAGTVRESVDVDAKLG